MTKAGPLVVLLSMMATGFASAPTFAQSALPAGDAAAGALVFQRCSGCHQIGLEAKIGIGPVLNGVVDRAAASAPGYVYSDALKSSGLIWNEATLVEFLRGPSARVPGTRMSFPGLTTNHDIADVIAFLRTSGRGG